MLSRIAAILVLAAAVPAQGAILDFGAKLLPEGVVTDGFGYTSVKIDTDSKMMTVKTNWRKLTGTTTVAHIHCCTATPFTGNAGVATTTPSFIGFPTGLKQGSFEKTYDMALTESWNSAFITSSGGTTASAFDRLVTNMQAGKTYFNLHTSVFGGGEIRSELAAVPEPATWGTLVLGFGLAGFAVRRRPRELKTTA